MAGAPDQVVFTGTGVDRVLAEGRHPAHAELHPRDERDESRSRTVARSLLAERRILGGRERALDLGIEDLEQPHAGADIRLEGAANGIRGQVGGITAQPVEADLALHIAALRIDERARLITAKPLIDAELQAA